MKNIEGLVRDNIKNLKPYSSARDEYAGSKGIFLDANENPFGKLNRYPDPHHRKLREEVSAYYSIAPESIFVGNGSDEAIDLLFRIFCNPGKDQALTFTPTYGMYEVSAAVNDVKMITIPLDENFDIQPSAIKPFLKNDKLKLIFLCSPNNPTSNSFSREKIIEVLKMFSGIVIVDEAYIDFSKGKSLADELKEFNNLAILRTFSKSWGAAAIRVGMVFSSPEIVSLLYKVKPPYNVSLPDQKAALKRISNAGKYRKQVSAILRERERLADRLSSLPIVKTVYNSDANFLLVKVTDPDRIYEYLTSRKVIVRNRNSVVPGCIRITVGKRKENERLIRELKQIII